MERAISRDELIKAEVFKAGNLVWGGMTFSDTDFKILVHTGLLPAAYHHRRQGFRPFSLCFGLLSLNQPVENYLNATHYGPKWSSEENDQFDLSRFAIIIDRQKVLSEFSQNIRATGSIFNSFLDGGFSEEFEFESSTVFGIPIQKPSKWEVEPFQDEVDIQYPREPFVGPVKGITTEFWSGFVTYKNLMTSFEQRMRSAELHLPIFSPEGDVLM